MRTKERIKTILLVVLLFGAVFLSYLVWTNYMGSTSGVGVQSVTLGASAMPQNGATPFAISYKTDAGRFGAAYHGGSVKGVYDKVRDTIGAALNDDVRPISDDVWKSALLKNGILVDYEGNVPLFIIAKDLGVTRKMPSVYGRYLLMTEDYIYVKDTQRDECYAMEHGEGKALNNVMAGLNASKCSLAGELGSTRVAGETLVFDQNISSFTINSINVTDGFTDGQLTSLLKIFGMNYNTCGRHVEQDGSRVYIEDLNTLKIAPDGYVVFESEEKGELAMSIPSVGAFPTDEELVEGANGIMSALSAFHGGDATLYLREVLDDGVVKYGRSFGGIPIDKGNNGYSAEIYLTENRVTRLSFHMRAYTAGTTVVSAFPQKLAIATVEGKSFGVLSLRYNDNSTGSIDAQWYIKK